VELQRRYQDIRSRGLGLAAISYDSRETLAGFAKDRGIEFPLLSDQGSEIIKRFGLLNTQQKPGTPGYGVPYPGTLIITRRGDVVSRFFEEKYQERATTGHVLLTMGSVSGHAVRRVSTAHLDADLSTTDAEVAPGHRFSLVLDVTPRRGVHIYAPPETKYRTIQVRIEPSPEIVVHAPGFPPGEIYEFKPLKERVTVYQRKFRIVQDVTLALTLDVRTRATAGEVLVINGTLAYQACDDKICFAPTEAPVTWSVGLVPLEGGRQRK
jgi:hypothetical protein